MSMIGDLQTATGNLGATIASVFSGSPQTAANFALVVFTTMASVINPTTPKFVLVTQDETNEGAPTLYFFNGTALQWIPSI